MKSLKQLLKEALLQEALPISKAKEYTSIKRNSAIQQRLDSIFDSLSQVSNAKQSKRGNRIYIPYTASKQTSPIEQEIESVLSDKGFSIKDYTGGVVLDKYGREMKLGRVLTKLDQTDLLNKFNTDKARASSKTTNTYIVFSKHPYDIAGQSTDRDWTSCMNLYTGGLKQFVSHDVVQGTFVVYYVSSDDLNINKPIGRISIKPFINIIEEKEVVYSTIASYVYGNPPEQFRDFVDQILSTIQKVNVGVFKLQAQLYCDIYNKIVNSPKRAELQTKEQVEHVVVRFDIKNYTINEDLTVDVNGDVNLPTDSLSELPVNFGKVTGDFHCFENHLTSIEGAPKEVGGNFICSFNPYLKSLKGGPQKVKGDYMCHTCNLNSLEGAPKEVGGQFYCPGNKLRSLKNGPEKVGGDFSCHQNDLLSLEGAPKKVRGNFICYFNELKSLKGGPEKVSGNFDCSHNKLPSLEGAPKEVGGFYCYKNAVKFTEEQVRQVSNVRGTIKV